jgi:hypothetical protein
MTEAWISLPSAIVRVRAHEGLSTGAANVRAIEAFSSGLVRTRWEAFQGICGGEAGTQPPIDRHAWAGADIPETDLMVSADGTRRRGITVNEADLTTWLSRARQGTSDAAAKPAVAPKRHRRYSLDDSLAAKGVAGILSSPSKWPNANQAAIALAPEAIGTDAAKVDRLGRKISKLLETTRNTSKD